MPSDFERAAPDAFQRSLTEIYGAAEFDPVCHAADEIFSEAADILKRKSVRAKLKSGIKVWQSSGAYKATLNDMDISYRLITERHSIHRNKVWGQIIALAINDNPFKPAAMLLPAKDGRVSASVVVGDAVNHPEHMDSVLQIIKHINQVSRFTDF